MEIWGGNLDADTGVQAKGLDAWVYSRPYTPGAAPGSGSGQGGRARAGGDIYYLTACATGRITRMLVADVSGHGETVARAARALKELLGEYANFIDQRRFVAAVNTRFGDIGGGDTGLFATAVVATYFSPTDELSVCSAGHPPALRYTARDGAWRALANERPEGGRPSNLPLGVLDDAAYAQTTIRLDEGDAVLFYTDAIMEARAPGGALLGVDGLVGLASSLGVGPGDGFIAAILAGVDRFVRTGEVGAGDGADASAYDDDVTLVLVRRNALKPRPSVALGLVGGWRVAKNVVGSIARGAAPAIPEFSVRALGGAFLPGFNAGKGARPRG